MTPRSQGLVFWSAIGALAAVAVFLVSMAAMILLKPEQARADLGGPFALTDFDGNTITEAVFEGQLSLLFFGFTHCPEVCPLTVFEMSSWFEELGDEAAGIRAYFVTVDPERDTPQVLADYLKPQSDRVVGITGSPDGIEAMERAWRVYAKKVPLDGGDYTMDHSTFIYLIDRNGDYWGHIAYGAGREEALEKLRGLLTS